MHIKKLDLDFIYEKIGYQFKDKSLISCAFTHSSYAHQFGMASNERLEFLGDAILDFIIADYLYSKGNVEGEMSKLRSFLVGSESLSLAIDKMGLEDYLLTGDSFFGEVTRAMKEDLFEAIVGAIYLDGGVNSAKEFIFSHIDMNVSSRIDYKTRLQEIVQKKINCEPVYKTIENNDGDGYLCQLFINNTFITSALANSKKESQTYCAKWAMEHIELVNGVLNK